MSDTYALPDPLPDFLPGESQQVYARRVVPGWTELELLQKKRRQYIQKHWTKPALADDPSLDSFMLRDIRDEGRWAWNQRHPENAKRIQELLNVVHWREVKQWREAKNAARRQA